jgi:hypothetical protein
VNEQTKARLAIIEAKFGKQGARAASKVESDAERASRFDEDFRRVRAEVLAPILEEIGAALSASGHGYRVEIDAGKLVPSIELHLILVGTASGSTGVIRLFTRTKAPHPHQIIAEVQLKGTMVEITRFHEASALTPEVVEQMVVDAVEQVFAYHSAS